ncbi:fimbrial assembly protein [Klebsiella sp. RIT-PI-d]|uniref:fimbria/pilus outer membrane usher protein n=1 Tax=Klebsiella sp. RIT-PI-d TaxID=1681196 RepID=UPI0006766323|nr:fimbria/pilus outer membrane usher protein [Klebsiella sp. RIT-PI-d]KNC12041.1 fimbrial assembly protein [Klebsiella sp. RIT-PI-d]
MSANGKKRCRPRLRRLVILQCISLLLCHSNSYAANEKKSVSFSQGFMHYYDSGIDLSQFDGAEKILPGQYKLEIYSNQKKVDSWPVRFVAANNEQGVNACLTPEMVIRFDVDTSKLPENWQSTPCLILPDLIPGATVKYNQEDERLDVTVPQAMLLNTPEGYISPELWDNGVPALTASYSISASSTHYREPQQETANYGYGNLLTSLDLGAWRFTTYDSAHMQNNGQGNDYEHIQAYAERAIASWQSQITLGDLSTTGDFFDTTGIRGVRLSTDDRMLPDSVRNYAPIVRGMANSNATVTIKQAGNTIYEKVVPPGEFAISDLYATGYSGDLEVTVKETDGKQTSFVVPYSSVPQLLREGYYRYSFVAGNIRNTNLSEDPSLIESTLQYGLMNNLTGYIGGQNAFDGDYMALMGGLAVNTWLGAVGIDVTRSFVDFDDMPETGSCGRFCDMSLRISLSRNMVETGTNFSLIGYRYSSKNYYSLSDAINLKQAIESGQQDANPDRYRERLEANINQMLPDGWGSFYVSGFVGNVWNEKLSHTDKSNFTLGYNNQFGSTNWGISVSRTDNDEGGHDDTIYLNVSLPLGHRYEKKAHLTANLSYNSDEANFRTALNGSAGEYSQLGFGGYFSQSNTPDTNFGMNLSWTGDSATTGMSYSQSRDSFMGGININGGIVAHPGGINFAPLLSDTIGIVEAKGAEGSHIYPDSRAVIKDNGYGIVSYLTPYKYNDVFLDPKGTAMSVDVDDTRRKIVPTAGSAVLIKMGTQQNKQMLVYFQHDQNESIPFGASINDAELKNIGIVGQGGMAMIPLNNGSNTFVIQWNKDKQKRQCTVNYQYKAKEKAEESAQDDINALTIPCYDSGVKK